MRSLDEWGRFRWGLTGQHYVKKIIGIFLALAFLVNIQDTDQTIRANTERNYYIKAEATEEDYQLITMGGSSLLARAPMNYIKPQVLGTLAGFVVSELVQQVIQCESGWNQEARGLAGEIGLAQYMPGTWRDFNVLRGTDLNINSSIDQVDMTVWAFDHGLECHWTCYKLLYPNICPK